jgi:hypothetical protein
VLLAPLPFGGLEFASGRLSRLSNICLSSRLGYSLLMRRRLADSLRGRALRRRIIGEIKHAKRFWRIGTVDLCSRSWVCAPWDDVRLSKTAGTHMSIVLPGHCAETPTGEGLSD